METPEQIRERLGHQFHDEMTKELYSMRLPPIPESPDSEPSQQDAKRRQWEDLWRRNGWVRIASWKHAMCLVRRTMKVTRNEVQRLRSMRRELDAFAQFERGMGMVERLTPGHWVKFVMVPATGNGREKQRKSLAFSFSPWAADYRREMQEKRR